MLTLSRGGSRACFPQLVVAINPGMLGEPAKFYKAAGEVIERVKSAERLPGVSEIVIPGQREAKLAAERVQQGYVPLEKNMLAELRVLADNYKGDAGPSSGGGDRTNQLLEQLLSRMDKLEGQVMQTAAQQQRLETVTVESLRGFKK